MIRTLATVFVTALLMPPAARAQQLPLVHYHFNDLGAQGQIQSVGTLTPSLSPLVGFNITGTGANGTSCLTGTGGTTSEIVTHLPLNQGNASWTIGFAIKNASAGAFNYAFSEGSGGFRAFTGGGAGAGNLRLTGAGAPTIDIAGGAGDAGWVHVAFVHDSAANVIRAYLNGIQVSSTAATALNLASGNPLVIGRQGTTCLLPGTLIDDFRFYGAALSANDVMRCSNAALDPKPEFRKMMVSEVSWASPRGIEITNHDTSTLILTGWSVKWQAGTLVTLSTPLNVTIGPDESIMVISNAGVEPLPTGTTALNLFPGGLPQPTFGFTIALLDHVGNVVDEVQVTDPSSSSVPTCAGGKFRGTIEQSTLSGPRSVERLWGLDSDGGRDWTQQKTRTFGKENTNEGARGTEPGAPFTIRINEIDDSPD
jgi:hypothetical protein